MNNDSLQLPIREFSFDKHGLTQNEQQTFDLLIEVAKLVAPLYLKQENRQFAGANFYPHDVTKAEILAANKKNPDILDPYTIVEKDDTGKMVAMPFHVKYHEDLKKIAEKLREAAAVTENEAFSKRLHFQVDALLDGSYEASDIYWLSMEPYKIDIVIGPIERYEDKLFFKKCAYQAWVGIWDENATRESLQLQNAIYTARRTLLPNSEKVDFLDKIQVRVDHTAIFSGLIARFMFTSTNLPNDVRLMEVYGSEITMFLPVIQYRFETLRYPIFQALFEKKFQQAYSRETLRKAAFNHAFLHEISHPLMRYRNSEDRLKELFPIFDELLASIFGIKACSSLLLKDAMLQKEFESLIVMSICSAFDWWLEYLKDVSVEHYTVGYAIAMNYFVSSGAIQVNNGFSWPNFTKLYVAIEELVTALERIVADGTYDDARQFVDKYGSLEIFKRFENNLQLIMPTGVTH